MFKIVISVFLLLSTPSLCLEEVKMSFDFAEFPSMPEQPDYTQHDLQNLYQDAWNLGLLSDKGIKNLFVQVLSWYDKDIHSHLKEVVEERKFQNSLAPTILSRYLPSYEEATDGEICIGTVVGNGYPYYVSLNDPHFGILGTTGFGKTVLNGILQKHCILNDTRFVSFSKKRDSRLIASLYPNKVGIFQFDEGKFKFNPKEPAPGIRIEHANTDAIFSFCQTGGILAGGTNFLQYHVTEIDKYFGTANDPRRQPSWNQIAAYIKDLQAEVKGRFRTAQYQESLENRFLGATSCMRETFNCSLGFPIEKALLDGWNLVLELHNIHPDYQLFATNSPLLRLSRWGFDSPDFGLEKLGIFLDDSQDSFPRSAEINPPDTYPILGMMATRFREVGVLFVSTQNPSMTSELLLNNCNTKIVMRMNTGKEAECAAELVGLNAKQKNIFLRLGVGEAICTKPGFPYPVLVKIDASPELLQKDFDMGSAWESADALVEKYSYVGEIYPDEKVEVVEEVPELTELERKVIYSIHSQPFLTQTVRGTAAGVDQKKISGIVNSLARKTFVTKMQFSLSGTGFTYFYNITKKGFEVADLTPPEGSGRFLHVMACKKVHRFLKDQGFQPVIEFEINGKRADVGYTLDDKYYAYEVCISNVKNVVDNAMQNLAAGFHETYLLVQDATIRDLAKKKLGDYDKSKIKFEFLTKYVI